MTQPTDEQSEFWQPIEFAPRRYRHTVTGEIAMLSYGQYNVYVCGRSGCKGRAVSGMFRVHKKMIEARMMRCFHHTPKPGSYEIEPNDIVVS